MTYFLAHQFIHFKSILSLDTISRELQFSEEK